MDNGIPLSKEDILTWQRILSKKGWFAVNWPEEYGGTGWTVTQKHIFQNEPTLFVKKCFKNYFIYYITRYSLIC